MTDRDTVNQVERMKATTCLNPLHTALAVYGCLLAELQSKLAVSGGKKPPCEKDLYRRAGYDGLEKRPYPASVPEAEVENLTYILQVFSFGFYIQAVS